MKFFVLLALAAVAAAKPDAQFYYGYPYASPHATAGLVTYANGAVTPVDTLSVQAAKAQHFAAKAAVYPYGLYGAHVIGKREAEAEADPALLYGAAYPYATGYGYTGYAGYAGYPGYTYGYPYAYSHVIGKREAEAEPKAEADAQFYYAPYYANPHASLGLTAYTNGAVTPTKTLAVQQAEAAHFAAKAAYYPYGVYGAHLIGKREAEAKADPALLYGAAYPYATGLGYTAYTGYPAAYGYGYPYAAYSYLG